jgi:hypothetical protein
MGYKIIANRTTTRTDKKARKQNAVCVIRNCTLRSASIEANATAAHKVVTTGKIDELRDDGTDNFTAPVYDVDSLSETGTKTRTGQRED